MSYADHKPTTFQLTSPLYQSFASQRLSAAHLRNRCQFMTSMCTGKLRKCDLVHELRISTNRWATWESKTMTMFFVWHLRRHIWYWKHRNGISMICDRANWKVKTTCAMGAVLTLPAAQHYGAWDLEIAYARCALGDVHLTILGSRSLQRSRENIRNTVRSASSCNCDSTPRCSMFDVSKYMSY